MRVPQDAGWSGVPFALAGAGLVAAIAGRTGLGTMAGLWALLAAIVLVLALRPGTRRLAPVVAPTLVAVAFSTFALTDGGAIASASRGDAGFLHRSAVLTGGGLMALVLIILGVDVARWLGRAVALATRAISATAGALLFVLIVIPGWLGHRLRPTTLLRRRSGARPSWTRTGVRPADPRSTGSSTPSVAHRTLTGRMTWGVGCVALILVANYGLGWAWDSAATARAEGSTEQIPGLSRRIVRDPRIDSPALADAPWRERYFADLQRVPGSYWPFTESRPLPFESPYLNIEGWSRQTYRAPATDLGAPVVWMFGGSTTFGEGQRDDYTIASWIARMAEEAGTPVRVENYGQRGWTHFQEAILFEQLLAAAEEPPDFVLFYDGANEITTQSLLKDAVPSHTLAASYAEHLSGGIATELVQEPAPEDVVGDLWHAYSQHSLAHKLVRQLQSQPAGAGTAPDDSEDPLFTNGESVDEETGQRHYDLTDQDGTDAGQVYARGQRITRGLSDQYRVEPFFFWQPVASADGPVQKARDELRPPTIDLSRLLLDHLDVFIDGGHTNEEGARLVAEELWATVEPTIVD
ncbi:MAG: hypothetical protein ACR2JF_01240, partial [Iamia sp.]